MQSPADLLGMYAAPTGMSALSPFASVAYGFLSWWSFALLPSAWLLTWVPTILAGLACGVIAGAWPWLTARVRPEPDS